jgi:hypothetical protein
MLGGAVAVATMAAGGCTADLNERLAIGTRATASFGGMPASGEPGGGMAGAGTQDRTRWATMVVVSPVDGVVHADPLRRPRPVGRRSPAERVDVFPVVDPVEEARGASGPVGSAAGLAGELGRSVMDPLLAPYRLGRAGAGGWWTFSPLQIWKRSPDRLRRGGSVAGVRREIGDVDE